MYALLPSLFDQQCLGCFQRTVLATNEMPLQSNFRQSLNLGLLPNFNQWLRATFFFRYDAVFRQHVSDKLI